MEPGTTLLKEVTVKGDRIREQGDTITYNVGSFAQQQDRSIGDRSIQSAPAGVSVVKSTEILAVGSASTIV